MRAVKRGDAAIILAALSVSLWLILLRYAPSEHKTARVYENGKLTHVIELDSSSEKREIKINGGVLTVENGSIRYSSSDCPDKLCQKFGELSRNGDTASCVPNKTVVTVTADKSDGMTDIITY